MLLCEGAAEGSGMQGMASVHPEIYSTTSLNNTTPRQTGRWAERRADILPSDCCQCIIQFVFFCSNLYSRLDYLSVSVGVLLSLSTTTFGCR